LRVSTTFALAGHRVITCLRVGGTVATCATTTLGNKAAGGHRGLAGRLVDRALTRTPPTLSPAGLL